MRKYMKVRRAFFKMLVSEQFDAGRHQVFVGEEPCWIIREWLKIKNHHTILDRLITNVAELAIPALRERVRGSSRNRIHCSVSYEELKADLLLEVNRLKKNFPEFWSEVPEVFEDFIKTMKSFKDFNMLYLMDFLATNELHDLWLIVATIKDYRDESAEDRFSL